MPEVCVVFEGHITQAGQAVGLPPVVLVYHYTRADSRDELVKFIENIAGSFISMRGMVVDRDPSALAKLDKWESDKIFVPMHSIAFMTTKVKQLVGEMPRPDQTGKQVLEDGTEPIKQ